MAKQPTYQGRKPYTRQSRSEPLATSVGRLTKPVFGRRGLADGAIARDWRAIVGDTIARHSQPEKITYAARERTNGLLHLRVDNSAMATQLQHLEPQLLERINGHFGYAAVGRLRFIHAPLPEPTLRHRERQTPQPTPERTRQLDALLEDIDDPELREALGKLGRALPES